jgi:hypothetical protein
LYQYLLVDKLAFILKIQIIQRVYMTNGKHMLTSGKAAAASPDILENQLQLTAACAILSMQNTCRQMEIPLSVERAAGWMQTEYKPHEDRGWLRTRLADIQTDSKDISRRFQASGIRTLDEQKAFLRSCLKLALDCVKAQMFLELEAPAMLQKQEQAEDFTITM